MRSFGVALQSALRDEEGLSTVEYALLLALVAVACISAWVALGADLRSVISRSTNSISQPLN